MRLGGCLRWVGCESPFSLPLFSYRFVIYFPFHPTPPFKACTLQASIADPMFSTSVVLSSLIRLIIFIQFVPSLPQHRSDTTYYESPFSYWSHIEASLGVISACLPVLRPIFVRPSPHSNNSSSGGSDSSEMGPGSGVGGGRRGIDRSDLKGDFEKGNPFDDAHALPVSKPAAEKDLEFQPTDFSLDHRYPEGMESDDNLADSRSGDTGGRIGAPIVRKPVPQLSMERELPDLPRLPRSRGREEELEDGRYEGCERTGEMI